ncbi:MAG: LysM peptidoglycan-binding domain-containing protein [Bacillota bacterium]
MGRFPPECPAGFIMHYFVIPGDTFAIIAQRLGTTTQALIAANPHISDPNTIRFGDVLCVPGFRSPTTCPPGFQGRYEVQFGDTMFSIAQRFNISVDELIAANPQIPNPQFIFPFDVLCVPG